MMALVDDLEMMRRILDDAPVPTPRVTELPVLEKVGGRMLEVQEHGGECCGMAHIFGFDYDNDEKDEMENELREELKGGIHGILTEVVLNRPQMKKCPWLEDVLKKYGFVMVTEFTNPNSGNKVCVFHRQPGRVAKK